MTEQDDLFVTNKEQQKEGTAASAVTAGDAAGGGIGEGEVRSVDPPVAKKSSNLWLLLILLVVLLGGYFLISMPATTEQNQQSVAVSEPKKQPIPDRQVQVVVVKQQAAEPPPADAEKASTVVEAPPVVAESPVAVVPPVTPTAEAVVSPLVSPAEVKETVVAAEPVVNLVAPAESVTLHSVMVGPFITKSDLAAAAKQLENLGFEPQQSKGRGMVTMTRLLEGRYPEAEAGQRLVQVQKVVGEAFIMPSGDKRAIYVGSFSDPERAADYAEELGKKGVNVTLVATEVEMNGHLLKALEAAPEIARQAADLIGKAGLKTQLVPK